MLFKPTFLTKISPQKKIFFTRTLFQWNLEQNTREMPWKGEKDPYRVWVSEVVLQQTRVEQGLDYYRRFITSFPTINSLASAPEDKVLKHWEGLGYYSRCRNLIHTAKYICEELDGKFPNDYKEILALKGIGTYTASAIASFVYNQPYAVVDGNVYRVLARFFGIPTPVDISAGKKLFDALAAELLDRARPGIYNQAIMDFGATVCKPAQPLCGRCPLQKKCVALQNGSVNSLPVKNKKLTRKVRYFNYFVFEYNNNVYVKKRAGKDIWNGLYEFYLVETEGPLEFSVLRENRDLARLLKGNKANLIDTSREYLQQLTHQTIMGRFFRVTISKALPEFADITSCDKTSLKQLPFPKFVTSYLED